MNRPVAVLFLILWTLLLFEGVAHLMAPQGMRIRNNHIILPRNQFYHYTHAHLRGCDKTIVHHKNSLGFRGPELPKGRPDIIAVGGSTTECFYLSDGHDWPNLLGKKLNRWTNNAGFDGHSTFGHIILVLDVLIKIHPKVILFLVGANDMGRDDLTVLDHTLTDQSLIKKAMRWIGEQSYIMAWIENISRAYAAHKRGLGHYALDLDTLPTEPNSPIPDQTKYLVAYRYRLWTLSKLCRLNGIVPIFITQPALYGNPIFADKKVTLGINGEMQWKILEQYNDVVRQIGNTDHIKVIDLAYEMPKDPTYFYDWYHFTNAGSEEVADILYRAMK